MTAIQWTDKTWNPTRGCRRISPGCDNCYAEKVAKRFSGPGMPYEGLVTLRGRWNGDTRVPPDKLTDPLHWRKPCRIFVDSMSDLFYEGFSDEQIAAVFGVMAACPQHTFQVLTKRPERARKWFEWVSAEARRKHHLSPAHWLVKEAVETVGNPNKGSGIMSPRWPLPNVWIGVSVENQKYADERIPDLLSIPAAVRFVSYEPALGPVDFSPWLVENCIRPEMDISWLVVGGESGSGARPFDIAWARSVVAQCKVAGVPVFVKQMGAQCISTAPSQPHDALYGWKLTHRPPPWPLHTQDAKGGDMSEWPADLRVREFPPCALL
jgi:protein gp37